MKPNIVLLSLLMSCLNMPAVNFFDDATCSIFDKEAELKKAAEQEAAKTALVKAQSRALVKAQSKALVVLSKKNEDMCHLDEAPRNKLSRSYTLFVKAATPKKAAAENVAPQASAHVNKTKSYNKSAFNFFEKRNDKDVCYPNDNTCSLFDEEEELKKAAQQEAAKKAAEQAQFDAVKTELYKKPCETLKEMLAEEKKAANGDCSKKVLAHAIIRSVRKHDAKRALRKSSRHHSRHSKHSSKRHSKSRHARNHSKKRHVSKKRRHSHKKHTSRHSRRASTAVAAKSVSN